MSKNNQPTIGQLSDELQATTDHASARAILRQLRSFGESGRLAALEVADGRLDFYLQDDVSAVFGLSCAQEVAHV